MTWHTNLKIRGIYGWETKPLCKEKDGNGEQCLLPEGHQNHLFPETQNSTFEERLRTIHKAIEEGNVKMAVDMVADRGGVIIQWQSDKGFGQLTIEMREDGTIRIDNEGDGRSTLLEILKGLLDQGTLADEPDPSIKN